MTATYRQEAPLKDKTLDVLKQHEDGTVDLGSDGVLTVGGCKVSDSPKVGECSLNAAPKAAEKPEPKKSSK
jgi:hypothetical protein